MIATNLVILNNRVDCARAIGGDREKQLNDDHAFCRVVHLVAHIQVELTAIILDLASKICLIVRDVVQRVRRIADAQATAVDNLDVRP